MKTRILLVLTVTAGWLEAGEPVMALVWESRGFVRGVRAGGTDGFLGIPYATPPTGNLRWRKTGEPPRWSGIRDATQKASECTQVRTGSDAVSGSEDCLYLNIEKPANTRPYSMLPVLVFFHGGSNQEGSGSDLDPATLAANGIVVVTVNYRLGVFGFLALPSLDAENGEPVSGNYGVMDQQAALRWVRTNIAAFGGNPLEVTVGGQSAGGIDVCAHLTSPSAARLFSKVILQSAYCPAVSHQQALEKGVPVATAAGCGIGENAAECMRAKPAAELVAAAGPGSGFDVSPNHGNSLLPEEPLAALSAGRWNRSAVLMGANHDEAALAVLAGLAAANVPLPLTPESFQAIVAQQFGAQAGAVLAEYRLDRYRDPFTAYADLITDISPTGCPQTPLADLLAGLTRVYRYEFHDPETPPPSALPPLGFALGAYHAGELQYLFRVRGYPGPATAAQKGLSRQMIESWARFVRTGDPGWPPYDAQRQIFSLRPGGSTVITNFEEDHHCAFWAQN